MNSKVAEDWNGVFQWSRAGGEFHVNQDPGSDPPAAFCFKLTFCHTGMAHSQPRRDGRSASFTTHGRHESLSKSPWSTAKSSIKKMLICDTSMKILITNLPHLDYPKMVSKQIIYHLWVIQMRLPSRDPEISEVHTEISEIQGVSWKFGTQKKSIWFIMFHPIWIYHVPHWTYFFLMYPLWDQYPIIYIWTPIELSHISILDLQEIACSHDPCMLLWKWAERCGMTFFGLQHHEIKQCQ